MSKDINPDRLHTLGLPLSNGRKPDCDDREKYELRDRHGKTEYDRWIESDREQRKTNLNRSEIPNT